MAFRPAADVTSPALMLHCLDAAKLDDRPERLVLAADGEAGLVVGREDGLAGQLRSAGISRRHARFTAMHGDWTVEDLDSTNGVFVNGERVTTQKLVDGDEVRLGPIRFRVGIAGAEEDESEGTVMVRAPRADDGDHTMMADSREASEAVLKAVRQAETPAAAATATPAAAPMAAPQPAKARRWPMVVMLLLALAAAGGWYQVRLAGERGGIEAAAQGSTAVARRLVDGVRERAAADLLAAGYDADLQLIATRLGELSTLLAAEPEALPLINAASRLNILEFERRLVVLLQQHRLADADALIDDSRARLRRIAADVPPGTRDSEFEDLQAARDLTEFAAVLLRFRRFSADFPLSGTQRPTTAQVQAMLDLKEEFARLRRLHNKTLSVHFLVLRAVVNDVEASDMHLVDQWRERPDGKGR